MQIHIKFTQALARVAGIAGQAATGIAHGALAAAKSKTGLWTAKTASKAFIVGAATAAGMSVGGPVTATVLATIAGATVQGGASGATPPGGGA